MFSVATLMLWKVCLHFFIELHFRTSSGLLRPIRWSQGMYGHERPDHKTIKVWTNETSKIWIIMKSSPLDIHRHLSTEVVFVCLWGGSLYLISTDYPHINRIRISAFWFVFWLTYQVEYVIYRRDHMFLFPIPMYSSHVLLHCYREKWISKC